MKVNRNGLLLLTLVTLLGACQNGAKESTSGDALTVEKENFAGSANFVVDTKLSTVEWKGTQKVSDKKHTGKISLQEGTLYVKDGSLQGGKVTIDMASLIVTDLEGNGKAKLEGHLKSEDFFIVETYPTATFEIASITPVDSIGGATHMVSGNLKMKDITKSVSFPAQVRISGNTVLATTIPFQINRNEWGVDHRSGILGTIKDKIIEDEVTLTLKVRAVLPQELQ
jgi:polyisoprenoid-binding protein YceI